MRIDYFLLSRKLLDRLICSEIHGHGIDREGFYGSDHCPLTMELGKATHEAGRAVECVQSKQFNALDA
jgi:hypothetical protein